MTISISVDPSNPGQFFACCGLFELANRVSRFAEGRFGNGEFFVECQATRTELFDMFANCCLTNAMTDAQKTRFEELLSMPDKKRKSLAGVEDEYKSLDKLRREAPIVLKSPFNLTLDWFTDNYAGGSRFKTWAGRQSVLEIAVAMKKSLDDTSWRDENCLRFAITDAGLPFNFDSDLGGQGGAIDIGFSFDPLAGSALTRIKSTARPVLELLAFVGLQRFRPAELKGKNRFIYSTWSRSLPISVAAPAACGVLEGVGGSQFEFPLLYRTKYLKSFLPAVPSHGVSND